MAGLEGLADLHMRARESMIKPVKLVGCETEENLHLANGIDLRHKPLGLVMNVGLVRGIRSLCLSEGDLHLVRRLASNPYPSSITNATDPLTKGGALGNDGYEHI